MARQGAYVTVPGGSANWASGLSSALSDLSKSYLQQGAAEDERARLAAAEAESKRRWELDRADTKAYRDAQQAESAARLAIAQAEADYKKGERERVAKDLDIRSGYQFTPEWEDLSGKVRSAFDKQSQVLLDKAEAAGEKRLAPDLALFTDENELSTSGRTELDRLTSVYQKEGLNKDHAAAKAYSALSDRYFDAQTDTLAVQEAEKDITAARERALANMTAEGITEAVRKDLQDLGYSDVYGESAQALIDDIIAGRGALTQKEVVAQGQAAATAAHEAAVKQQELNRQKNKDLIDLLKAEGKTTSSSKSTSGSTPDKMTNEELMKSAEKFTWGSTAGKEKTLQAMVENVWNMPNIKDKVPIDTVRQAVYNVSVKNSMLDNEPPNPGSTDDIKEVEEEVTHLMLGKKGTSGGKTEIAFDESAYISPKPNMPSRAAILAGLASKELPMSADYSTVGRDILSSFDRSLLGDVDPVVQADRVKAAQTKAAEEKAYIDRIAAATQQAGKAKAKAAMGKTEAERELQAAINAEIDSANKPSAQDVARMSIALGAEKGAITPQAAAHGKLLQERAKAQAVENAKRREEDVEESLDVLKRRLETSGKSISEMKQIFEENTDSIYGATTPNYNTISRKTGIPVHTLKFMHKIIKEQKL